MNTLFDYQSFLSLTQIVEQTKSKRLDKKIVYLYNNLSNLLIYISDNEEKDDINFCEQLYNNVLQSALTCNYTKADLDKSIFIISLRNDITIKEDSLIYLYQQHFSFDDDIHLINQDLFGGYYFFLFQALDKQLYKLASLMLEEWNSEKSNLYHNMIPTISIDTRHPLLHRKMISFQSSFSDLTLKFNNPHLYLPEEYIAYYFYLHPTNQYVTQNQQNDFFEFKKLFDSKISINELLKETILSLYIKTGLYLNSNSIHLLEEWDICSHKGKAVIHLIEEFDFHISGEDTVDLKGKEFSLLIANWNNIFQFLRKENINFIELWSDDKINKLLNHPKVCYQYPTSSHIHMYEHLTCFFHKLNYLTKYFNLEKSELTKVKNKVEYNLNELGKGIKDPLLQQSFIETSLKIEELFYQYSHNTNDTYIQKNKTKIRL